MSKLSELIQRKCINATRYSVAGFKAAFTKEESFRLELLGLAILLLIMIFVPWPLWKKILLTASYQLIPLMEVLNSAIEDICDLVNPGRSDFVKTAKDKGSMAVLYAIIINALVLVALIAAP